MRIPLNYTFLLPLLLVSLTSCSVIHSSINPWEGLPAGNNRGLLTKDDPAAIKNEIARQLAKENYLLALSALHQGVENGQSESSLTSEYLQVLQGIFQQAEALMAEEEFDEAGLFYRAALDGFPRDEEVAKKAPLSKEVIQSKIEACADQLMENGLLSYRSGELDTAIGTWKKILVFQPQHEASQKAIHTANLQLTNLNSMDKEQSPRRP